MAADYAFRDDEMVVDEGLGFPKAYARICRDGHDGPFSLGPPFTYFPYASRQHEGLRIKELEKMFPVIDPKAKSTAKARIFVSLLWKQLNHLGNAGFDPAVIRVDPYGNVLYYHADSASPLGWEIDHWFPCSRGGLTVPKNLRILQWQVCRRKHNKLQFQVPWWDFQLGISVNQFLSIFASSNSDFRHRAFCFLFAEGENEEINSSQTVESHSFPQHFAASKKQIGFAAAAIVHVRGDSADSALKSLDYNSQARPVSPAIAVMKVRPSSSKENESPDLVTNPYQAIVMARDSLKHREETQKRKMEIQQLDEEVDEMRRKTEEENMSIQELETELIKRRRRVEKCRKLAESQCSYRMMLEKMIRDAMHQSVVYKEQVRLNQAATNALMARLEAQKAICDSAEKELHKKFKQRDELEQQIRHECEQGRKRSRTKDSLSSEEDLDHKSILYLPGGSSSVHKELRVFLQEEHKASEDEEQKCEEIMEELQKSPHGNITVKGDEENRLEMGLEGSSEREEDDEIRRQRGKGNIDKWMKMLLENSTTDEAVLEPEDLKTKNRSSTDEIIIRKLDDKYPLKTQEGVKQCIVQEEEVKREREIVEVEERSSVPVTCATGSRDSDERKEKKERGLVRSHSARALKRIPSSPSLLLSGMKKGVDCMRMKPIVTSDEEEYSAGNNFLRSSFRTLKRAVKK